MINERLQCQRSLLEKVTQLVHPAVLLTNLAEPLAARDARQYHCCLMCWPVHWFGEPGNKSAGTTRPRRAFAVSQAGFCHRLAGWTSTVREARIDCSRVDKIDYLLDGGSYVEMSPNRAGIATETRGGPQSGASVRGREKADMRKRETNPRRYSR